MSQALRQAAPPERFLSAPSPHLQSGVAIVRVAPSQQRCPKQADLRPSGRGRPYAPSALLARLLSNVPNSLETCGPSTPPRTGPSGPFTSTVWLTLALPATSSILQLNRNAVPGTTLVSRAKLRPGTTSMSFIL